MGLELRRATSEWWYGKFQANGRTFTKNLGVKVEGRVPPTIRETGDIVFERSRARAQAALEKAQAELKRRSAAEELVQTLHEIRTGQRVRSVPLPEIAERWAGLLRRRPLSDAYRVQGMRTISRFIAFVRKAAPGIHEMSQVQSSMATSFCHAEIARGIAAQTYNQVVIHLRSVFHLLRKEAGMAENPFEGIPLREGDTVFRKPFTVEELAVIEEKAKADPFIYPLIVTGMCTAMRRGDCCTLLRDSVDLKGGFVTVKTSKTGETVQIPIFPLLRGVLEEAMAKPPERPNPPHYVFPALEAHYRINADHLTDRVRRVLRAAGFIAPEEAKDEEAKAAARGEVQRDRERGVRRASIRDFHSFRVSWVTVALTAGVPLEIVQRVTGHRTTDIVLKHYFQPGKEDFRRTLAGKLPALLGERSNPSSPTPEAFNVDELRAKLAAMEASTWRHIRDELLERLPLEVNVTPPAKSVLQPSFAA